MRHQLAAAFVIAGTAGAMGIAYPADETQAVTFSLNNTTGAGAATVLRTIADVRKIEAVDDHTVTVRDTPEKLELATEVVKLLDTNDDTADTPPLPAGDGAVIVAVALDRASAKDVMVTLRKELQIARIAVVGERRVFLRDTDSQVGAALKVIERLELAREGS